jgi:hypothetical protein
MTRLEGSSNFYLSSFVYSRPFSRAFLDKSQSLPLCRLDLPPYFNAWTRSESPSLLSYTPLFPYSIPHTSTALVHIRVLIHLVHSPTARINLDQAWRPEDDQGFQTFYDPPPFLHLRLNLQPNHTSPSQLPPPIDASPMIVSNADPSSHASAPRPNSQPSNSYPPYP